MKKNDNYQTYISLKYINNNFYRLIKAFENQDFKKTFKALQKAYLCFQKELYKKLNC